MVSVDVNTMFTYLSGLGWGGGGMEMREEGDDTPIATAKTLVISYILPRLDYCNYLLMGTPNSGIQPLWKLK